VSDHDDRFLPCKIIHSLHNCPFSRVIEGTGRLIHNNHIRVVIKGSGNAYPLLLTARESGSTFTDMGLITLRQFIDNKFMEIRNLRSFNHCLMIYLLIWQSKRNIASNRIIG